jgi:plastocyanin domain-containing protein
MQAGAVLIATMGLVMFTNGWNLAGFFNPVDQVMRSASMKNKGGTFAPEIRDGVQIVNSTLLPNRYPAITVQQGVAVRWTINAPPGSINGCNNRFIVREYGIMHTFKPGENVIEFLPEKTGRFPYSCWMGMIRSSITVLAEGESVAAAPEPSLAPVPAGVDISTDGVVLAQSFGNYQTAGISLTDDGFDPAIIVMARGVPALWNINIDSLDPGSRSLVFPAYYKILETEQGDNTLQVLPDGDFEFSTGDNVFYGYVKVVDDINKVDIESVKAEVADFETLIYPEDYFDNALSGGCCQ